MLWDAATSQQLGPRLTGHKAMVIGLAFSPDGKTLASVDVEGTIVLWDVDIESWKSRACRIANRNLSCEEWRQYLGDEPYQATCPDLPYPKDCGKKAKAE